MEEGYGRHAESGWAIAEFCTQNAFLTRSFGAHKAWRLLWNATQRAAFMDYCPEARPLNGTEWAVLP